MQGDLEAELWLAVASSHAGELDAARAALERAWQTMRGAHCERERALGETLEMRGERVLLAYRRYRESTAGALPALALIAAALLHEYAGDRAGANRLLDEAAVAGSDPALGSLVAALRARVALA
jgi:hypothetical protein